MYCYLLMNAMKHYFCESIQPYSYEEAIFFFNSTWSYFCQL